MIEGDVFVICFTHRLLQPQHLVYLGEVRPLSWVCLPALPDDVCKILSENLLVFLSLRYLLVHLGNISGTNQLSALMTCMDGWSGVLLDDKLSGCLQTSIEWLLVV